MTSSCYRKRCKLENVHGPVLYRRFMENTGLLLSGSTVVNALLEGGMLTAELIELSGSMGTGKTQFCHMISAATVANTPSSVLYLDANGTFSAERIFEILKFHVPSHTTTEEIKLMLNRISCRSISDVFGIMAVLKSLLKRSAGQIPGLKLLIIDCLGTVLSPAITGRHRRKFGCKVGYMLRRLACDLLVAVVVTNNTVRFRSVEKPAMGQWWGTNPHTRILLVRHGAPLHVDLETSLIQMFVIKSNRMITRTPVELRISQRGLHGVYESFADSPDSSFEYPPSPVF